LISDKTLQQLQTSFCFWYSLNEWTRISTTPAKSCIGFVSKKHNCFFYLFFGYTWYLHLQPCKCLEKILSWGLEKLILSQSVEAYPASYGTWLSLPCSQEAVIRHTNPAHIPTYRMWFILAERLLDATGISACLVLCFVRNFCSIDKKKNFLRNTLQHNSTKEGHFYIYLMIYRFRVVVFYTLVWFPATAQSLVFTLLYVSATNSSHHQGAITLKKQK
jgi:hypothetical protein